MRGSKAKGVLLLLSVLSSALPATHAGALSPCVYDSSDHRVTVGLEGWVRRNGDAIEFKTQEGAFAPCGAATVHNTDEIVFVESAEEQVGFFGIRLSGGPFEPGRTEEPSGVSEIEFEVDFVGPRDYSWGNEIWVKGSSEGDSFTGGADGMMLNDDDDLDVRVTRLAGYRIGSKRGADAVYLDGRRGTGRFDPAPWLGVDVQAGSRDDVVVGSPGADQLSGGPGRDELRAKGSDDSLEGGQDSDLMDAGPGADDLYGYAGNDRIGAGSGQDEVEAGTGADIVRLGPGSDSVIGQGGDDRVWGGPGKDGLFDSGGRNHFWGGLGADTLFGGHDDDKLEGNAGDDTLRGRPGADHLDGDAGRDGCAPGRGVDSLEDCEYTLD